MSATMATVCPTCLSAIDPARAPAARVRGLKVVVYCSAACADRGVEPLGPPGVAAAARGPETVALATASVGSEAASAPVAIAESGSHPDPSPATSRPIEAEADRRSPVRRAFADGRRGHIVVASSIALVCGMGIVAVEA